MLTWITKSILYECLDVISCFDEFVIYHIPRHVDNGANILTHQTSGYMIRKDQFHIKRPMFVDTRCTLWTNRSNRFLRPVWPDFMTGLTACGTGLIIFSVENTKSAMVAQNHNAAEVSDWRKSFIDYLQSSCCIKVRHFTFSYILMMSYAIKMPKVCSWQ